MNPPNSQPYPLIFEPILKEKVWGGDKIANKLGKASQQSQCNLKKIGESWELADLPVTSNSGGGGSSEHSTISNGNLKGQSLRDAIAMWGEKLIGQLELCDIDGQMCFPILLKYLNSSEPLSIQAHPSESYASAHENAYLKHEAWYILEAEPGAAVYRGFKAGVSFEDFKEAIQASDSDAILDCLNKIEVKRGDCYYFPSGVCHMLGPGVLAIEVQTPSDTTYRLHDWNRGTRELHVEQGLEAMLEHNVDTADYEKRTHIAGMFTTLSRLIFCDAFRIEKVRMVEGFEQEIPYNQPTVWMVIEGSGHIHQTEAGIKTPFCKGQTLLIPAELGHATIHLAEDTIWLEVTFPSCQAEAIN